MIVRYKNDQYQSACAALAACLIGLLAWVMTQNVFRPGIDF